jgi:hypothetical protein
MDNETLAREQIELEYAKLAQARVDIRATIDTETVKALQLINGGMAAGLVTLLPVLARDPSYVSLAHSIVVAIAFAACGLVSATVHNRLRRKCNLAHEGNKPKDPYTRWPLRWWASEAGEWRVCTNSVIAMWLSIGFFILGAAWVVCGFWRQENYVAARAADAQPAAAAEDNQYELIERSQHDVPNFQAPGNHTEVSYVLVHKGHKIYATCDYTTVDSLDPTANCALRPLRTYSCRLGVQGDKALSDLLCKADDGRKVYLYVTRKE